MGEDLWQQLADMVGDALFICRSRVALQHLNRSGTPVFKFVFNQRGRYDPSPASWGVYHSSELPFIFGTDETGSINILPNMTAEERSLTHIMRNLWSSVALGARTTPVESRCPPYVAERDNHLWLVGGPVALPEGRDYHGPSCDVWDSIWKPSTTALV